MQSLHQHRRIGRMVEIQVKQHQSKQSALRDNGSLDHQSEIKPIETATETSDASHTSQDLERASESIDTTPTYGHHDKAPQQRTDAERKQSLDRSNISHDSTRQVGMRLGEALAGVNVRAREPDEKGGDEEEDTVFVVGFRSEDDPLNPHNWSPWTRAFATVNVTLVAFMVGIASSIDSSIIKEAAAEFHVSEVVESMAVGLFLIGFGFGALAAGPVSEAVGRNPVYISSLVICMIFIMASALAPNVGAQLVFRFIAGIFASTPLTCGGGSLADMWDAQERVLAFPIFAIAAFVGPVAAPACSGWIAQKLYWRWTEWITLIGLGLSLISVSLTQPETYAGVILSWKAAHLRRTTGDQRYIAPLELQSESFSQRLVTALYRPFIMTAQEPIVILVALYLMVIYIILFTFFDGYDYIFGEVHGVSQGITGTCFLGIAVGLCLASLPIPLVYRWAKRDLAKLKAEGKGDQLPPEFRLWYSMLGGSAAIPISLFWMGWTSYPSISIWSPLAASVFFGYGILTVFISVYQYMIDAYEAYAASALAAVTVLRYVAAGGMSIVGIPFYKNLGIHYTLTILGCISTLLVPVPFIFFFYGEKIRKHSKFAAGPDEQ